MSQPDIALLRDRVIDRLLEDDVLMEGILYLVCREVMREVHEERERHMKRLRDANRC